MDYAKDTELLPDDPWQSPGYVPPGHYFYDADGNPIGATSTMIPPGTGGIKPARDANGNVIPPEYDVTPTIYQLTPGDKLPNASGAAATDATIFGLSPMAALGVALAAGYLMFAKGK